MAVGEISDTVLDDGIAYAVEVLRSYGIETYESCEGGDGHSFPEPTVCFHGGHAEGWRAMAIAMESGLPVRELRHVWRVEDGNPTGPRWHLVFHPTPKRRRSRLTHSVVERSPLFVDPTPTTERAEAAG